jgi:hypothetical protein
MRNKTLLAVLFCVAGGWHVGAQASSSLGGYIGVAIGRATIRADQVSFLDNGVPLMPPASYSASDTGWKVFAGIRPISLLAAEIEYVDFGNPAASKTITGYGTGYTLQMSAKAAGAFGLLYAPIPIPFLNIYGKAGVVELRTSTSGIASRGCVPPLLCPIAGGTYERDRTDTRLGYGAGLQLKIGRFAIRSEYERIDASTGDPDLFSVGATWSF